MGVENYLQSRDLPSEDLRKNKIYTFLLRAGRNPRAASMVRRNPHIVVIRTVAFSSREHRLRCGGEIELRLREARVGLVRYHMCLVYPTHPVSDRMETIHHGEKSLRMGGGYG